MNNEQFFDELVIECLGEDTGEVVLNYLHNNTDFYTAPASTRYHGNFKGGLLEHSLNVFEALSNIPEVSNNYSTESIMKVSLLHDLCKTNFYKVDFRNTKNEAGQWIKVPYYTVKDEYPFGHGEKSVDILRSLGVSLKTEEALAIRWHMGGFEPKEHYNYVSDAYSVYPLAMYLHVADLIATYRTDKKID